MEGGGADILEARDLIRPGSRTPLASRSSAWWCVRVRPSPTSARWTGCGRRYSPRSPSPTRTVPAAHICRPLGSSSSASPKEVASKTRKVRGPPSGELVAAVVARGEAEIGFQQVAELIHERGADFVGTVPVEIQPPTLFVGALPKGSEHEDAAVALLRFLSSADAAGVITKAGLKPLAAAR